MKIKIIGIFLMILLVTSASTVIGQINKSEICVSKLNNESLGEHEIILDPNDSEWDGNENYTRGNTDDILEAYSNNYHGSSNVFPSSLIDEENAYAGYEHYFNWKAPCDVSNAKVILMYVTDRMTFYALTSLFGWATLRLDFSYVFGDIVEKDNFFKWTGKDGNGFDTIYYEDTLQTHVFEDLNLKKDKQYKIGVKCDTLAKTSGPADALVMSQSTWQENDYTDDTQIRIIWENRNPTKPSNPSPRDGSTGVDNNKDLSWDASSDDDNDPITYDIYFGTSSNPSKVKSGHSSTSYNTGTMSWSTEYHWKIVAKDSHGGTASSGIWSFTVEEDPTCFPAGTKITMTDGSYKNIEDIKQGDRIMSYDILHGGFSSWPVFVIPDEPLNTLYEINNGLLNLTAAHPLYIQKPNGKTGWGAIIPTNSLVRLREDGLNLEIGDQVFTSNKEWIEVTNITYKSEPVQVYNIWSFSGKQNYFANDILVFEEHATVPHITVMKWYFEQWLERHLN